ncbi:MAG: DUF3667 domain-containing protein [Lewinellaceae bacterium]|nr:DUF3667 domain-containing protein [Lewinellaceae bacterium]
MTCLNCDSAFSGNFCPECGQEARVGVLTIAVVTREGLQSFLDVDRGLVHNWVQLTLRPRTFIHDYLKGKRVQAYNPLKYVILGVTILVALQYFAKPLTMSTDDFNAMSQAGYSLGRKVGTFIREGLRYFWLLYVLYFTLAFRLFYRGYSFAEALVAQSFIVGHACFVAIVLFAFWRVPLVVNPIFYVVGWLMLAVSFPQGSWPERILVSFLTLLLAALMFILTPFLVFWWWPF